MSPNNYLFFDTETGGLDPRAHSLLSMGLVVGDASGVADSLEILVKHEPYMLSGGGMKVNRIDIARHDETALTPHQALETMEKFLGRFFAPETSIALVGHNVYFDRAFLEAFLASCGKELEPRFSHRLVDTHSIAAALRDAGRLKTTRLSSTGLFEFFGIHIPEGKRHTALGDAIATYELYWKLVGLMK